MVCLSLTEERRVVVVPIILLNFLDELSYNCSVQNNSGCWVQEEIILIQDFLLKLTNPANINLTKANTKH